MWRDLVGLGAENVALHLRGLARVNLVVESADLVL